MKPTLIFVLLLGVALFLYTRKSERDPKSGTSAKEEKLKADDFGKNWPFTVKEGTVACSGNAVTFTSGGVIYAVNGTAMSSKKYDELEKIWLPADPIWITDRKTSKKINAVEGNKKSIAEIMEKGLSLCK